MQKIAKHSHKGSYQGDTGKKDTGNVEFPPINNPYNLGNSNILG
jgi:hypothetical protein